MFQGLGRLSQSQGEFHETSRHILKNPFFAPPSGGQKDLNESWAVSREEEPISISSKYGQLFSTWTRWLQGFYHDESHDSGLSLLSLECLGWGHKIKCHHLGGKAEFYQLKVTKGLARFQEPTKSCTTNVIIIDIFRIGQDQLDSLRSARGS